MLLSLAILFTLIGSASAVSDDGSFDDLSLDMNDDSSVNSLSTVSDDDSIDGLSDLSESKDAEKYNILVSNDNDPENLSADLNDSKISDSNMDSSNNPDSNGPNNPNDSNGPNDSNSDLNSVGNSKILPQYIKVKDGKAYSSNSQIQKIIDDANPGSTIEFTGSFYKDLRLKINKPLNIISKCGTVINLTFDMPVFTIEKGGSGTNISGFVINSAGSFVEASDVSNISIMKNKISAKKTAIIFKNVLYSNIKNNRFSSFKTAINLQKSRGITISKNNITPDKGDNVGINIVDCGGPGGVRIYDNRIIGFNVFSSSTGIKIGKNVSNVIIKGNTITDWNIGVHFLDSIVNVKIRNNTISHNGDGLVLDRGVMDRLNFTKNVLSDNFGVGFLFEDDFEGALQDPVFKNNIFSNNNGMAVQSKGYKGFNIGRNFLNGNKLCVKIKMKKGFSVKIRKSGNKIFASVIGDGGSWATDLPDFDGTLNINGKDYKVQFKGGLAYVELDDSGQGSGDGSSSSTLTIGDESRSLSEWGEVQDVSYEEIMSYVQPYLESFETPDNDHSDDNDDYDNFDDYNDYDDYNSNNQNSTNGHNSNPNSAYGSGDSGLHNGSSSISSTSSSLGSTSSAGASSAGASSSSSAPSAPADSPTIKSLSVDEETFRVVGVTGLVLLILLVIGLYYREDIHEMMKD